MLIQNFGLGEVGGEAVPQQGQGQGQGQQIGADPPAGGPPLLHDNPPALPQLPTVDQGQGQQIMGAEPPTQQQLHEEELHQQGQDQGRQGQGQQIMGAEPPAGGPPLLLHEPPPALHQQLPQQEHAACQDGRLGEHAPAACGQDDLAG